VGQILDMAVEFFNENSWQFSKSTDEALLQSVFQGDSGEWPCYFFAHEEQSRLAFYSVCPARVSEDRRSAAAEFITRVNRGLIIGNFEMDLEDGEICLKTSLDFEGDRLTKAFIKRLALVNLAVMDTYLPGIMKVLYGRVSPAQAVAEIEKTPP
jgi:hypothetical protein